MNGSDGCTTMYLMPLNWLKMVKTLMSQFVHFAIIKEENKRVNKIKYDIKLFQMK